mgnify:CR=1 FL=1
MRRIRTTVTSNGATLYTMTHYNKIHASHEKRNENDGNIRWKRELKPLRNTPKDKTHYYERF